MRKIKFRGWNRELKVMVYSNELTGGIEYECNPVRALNIILNEDYHGFDYMQYTGLKDKNGTKIYEADILEVESYEGSIEVVSVVFEDGCFCHFGYLGDLRTYPLRDFLFNGSKIKVIGNIHENPELLEVTE